MFAMVKLILCVICIISIISETTTENVPCFLKELKKTIRDSDPTKSPETVIENDNSSKLELPKISDSIQNISKTVTEETEKETITSINLLNPEQTKETENTMEISSTTEFSNPESANKEKIAERMLTIVTNSSNEKQEISDEGSENSTINLNCTKKSDLPFDSNFTESEKNRERVANETIVDDAQKSVEKLEPNKEKRQIDDKVKYENVFLKAYKNCKLLVGERFLRMDDQNPVKVRNCVFAELQKMESFGGQYTKLLDNSKFIKKM